MSVEFRQSIGAAIPKIIALLSSKDMFTRWAGADSLTDLSEHGKSPHCLV